MTSAIDSTKPVDGIPASKADLRDNLEKAKNEITAAHANGIPVTFYGAKCDCKRFSGTGAITAGQVALTVSDGTFDQSDVGKAVEVEKAGAQFDMWAHIASVTDGTTVELDRKATYTVSGADGSFHGAARSGSLSITAGSTTLTDTAASFTVDDVGKAFRVASAGSKPLYTTIATVASATSLTVADVAVTTVSDGDVISGTDDTPAFEAAIAASLEGRPILVTGFSKVLHQVGVNGGANQGAIFPLYSKNSTVRINGHDSASSGLVYRAFGDKNPMYDWQVFNSQAWQHSVFGVNRKEDGSMGDGGVSLWLSDIEIDMGYRVANTGSSSMNADTTTGDGWGKGHAISNRSNTGSIRLERSIVHGARAEVIIGTANATDWFVDDVFVHDGIANGLNFGADNLFLRRVRVYNMGSSGYAISARRGGFVLACSAARVDNNWIGHLDEVDADDPPTMPLVIDAFSARDTRLQAMEITGQWAVFSNFSLVDCNTDPNSAAAILVAPSTVMGHGSKLGKGIVVGPGSISAAKFNTRRGVLLQDADDPGALIDVTVRGVTMMSIGPGQVRTAVQSSLMNANTARVMVTENVFGGMQNIAEYSAGSKVPVWRNNNYHDVPSGDRIQSNGVDEVVLGFDDVVLGTETGLGATIPVIDTSRYSRGHKVRITHWAARDPVTFPANANGFRCQAERTLDNQDEIEFEFDGTEFVEQAYRQFA